MKKTIILLTIVLISCLTGFCTVFAQEAEYTEVDASALSAGQPFRFTVTIGSDESLSFSGAQARLTAILCPAEQSTGDCQVMNQVADGEDSTSMRITFEVDSLPAEGDYTLQISFRDETGTFETRSVNYLLKGVKEAAEEPPSDIVPEIVTSVRVVPALLDTEGTSLIYGSTVYVNEPYTLQITADSSMNNSVALQVALPASLLAAPLDPSSECLQYLNEEGTALVIPGSRWDASDGNTFTCELRFNDSAYLAANPLEFTLINPTGSPNGYEETYEMEKLSWNYYPVNIAKFPATHQLQISDSRGNLICSDNVPCGVFNADDVYVMTYKFPSDWGAVMPAGRTLTAEVEWPEDWAAGLGLPDSLEIASEFGEACTVGPDGRSVFTLEETEPGRYSASCTFVPSGIASPKQAQALIHLDDNSYQVNDLKVWLPGTIVKTQAVLTPSLSLRMTEGAGAEEQIQNGAIGKLYRTAGEFPNSDGGAGAPALYTLRAEISGVSSSRRPQPGDAVNVKWPVLDSLAATGDLPACLTPYGDSYALGTLEKTEEGTWRAECDFRFPETMDTSVQGGTLQMDLVSGAYQTSAKVQMTGTPFSREPLYVDLNVPDHMLLMQATNMSVSLSDGSGGLSDYLRAVLAASGGAGLQADWEYNMFTDCNGVYALGDDGTAVCSAHFEMPTDTESDMHFELTAPALENLFDIQFRPAADIHIAAVSKMDAELTAGLGLRMTADSAETDQLAGGSIGTLYRTASDFANGDEDGSAPALYTLRASVAGLVPGSEPQPGDYIEVNWPLLDSMAAAGDIPSCLSPAGDGYMLGSLQAREDGTWSASCAFRFPMSMSSDTAGAPLSMELVSAAYNGSSRVEMSGQAFRQEPLYIDIDVPESIPLRLAADLHVRVSDSTGGLSDYTRAVLGSSDFSLYNDWDYNYVTDCQGVFNLDENGEAACSAFFELPADESNMHFELAGLDAAELFDVEFRPGADIRISGIDKTDAVLKAGLGLRMTAGADETNQLANGTIGTLYRTAGDYPNGLSDDSAPALYTLSASVSGIFSGSEPQPEDYVEVRWTLLDSLASAGDLPTCLTPAGDGYMLGELQASEDDTWTAFCDFRFPQSMDSNTPGGPLSMELVSAAYNGQTTVEMSGQAFRQEPLYVDIEVPGTIPLRMAADLRVRVSDSSGGLSDYTRALLQSSNISVFSDWDYNYATDCQGLYELNENGEAVCSAYFELPTGADSNMHFELEGLENGDLFDVQYRPAADFHIAGIDKTQTVLTPSLTMRMTADAPETSEIRGGVIGTLYRSTGEIPNAEASADAPALYSLKAEIGGTYPGSAPEPGDYVLVRWALLDELAMTGDLPSCLTPDIDGFMLGTLTSDEGGTWSASCDFRFPATMPASISGSPMEMELVSAAYEGSAQVEMSGQPFRQDTLYVNLDIPSHMLLRQMTEFHVRVTDSTGGLSDYTRAVLNSSGVSLISDWDYNYVTTCQGLYELTVDGESSCSAIFETPTDGSSVMHFDLISPALENLFTVEYQPSADIHVDEITNIQARLTVKLLHDGSEIALPAMDDAYFEVLDDYQLQFTLTPAPEYQDVVNAVSVDSEGLVLDWYEPLLVLWDAIPGGQTGLNFYRDGDHFTARYDFSFGEGDIFLSGNMGRMVPEVWIDGWDVEVPTGLEPISMPSRIERKALELTFSDFIETESGEAVGDLTVNREAQFDVNFKGLMEYFDPAALDVGYDANGITNPVTCDPDYQAGKLHCTIYPMCSDYTTEDYGTVCGTNISLYAVYMGDTVNDEAKAEPKQFNIKRSPLRFVPAEGESLTNDSLRRIMESAGDGQYMDGSSVTVGGWRVDSFLPRQIWGQNGVEDGVYPVVFRYDTPDPAALDQTLLRLEVVFDGGSASLPVEDKVLLAPSFVSDDMAAFELDFGSMDMMDDGRIVADVLEDAVSIKSMTIRYYGSPMVAPASRAFESAYLDFPLKVATLYDLETDLSVPGILQFGGAFASEAMMQSFTVHCSQLIQPLQCSLEPPVEITVPEESGDSDLTDEELWALSADSVLTTIDFQDQGCWGKIGTPLSGMPLIYVNNVLDPQCYLTAWNENRQIWIAANRY